MELVWEMVRVRRPRMMVPLFFFGTMLSIPGLVAGDRAASWNGGAATVPVYLPQPVLPVEPIDVSRAFPDVAGSRVSGLYGAVANGNASAARGGASGADASLPELVTEGKSASFMDELVSKSTGDLSRKVVDGLRRTSQSGLDDAVAATGSDMTQAAIDLGLSMG